MFLVLVVNQTREIKLVCALMFECKIKERKEEEEEE